MIRYIQTHPISGKTAAVHLDDYDGTAEIWFDSIAGLEAVLGSQFYAEKVFPDEKTFLDHERTLVVLGEQVEIIGASRAGTGDHPIP